jgi:mannose-6-phosphate isomerase-like protein (cupin superfamily)
MLWQDEAVPIFPPGSWLNPENPAGHGTSSAGRFAIPFGGARFDRHHHDDDELWFITAGKARMLLDGELVDVQAGDIVLVPAGSAHDVVEVYEAVSGFFTETGHPSGGRTGHLHADAADAAGHEVPARPVPDGFPRRAA